MSKLFLAASRLLSGGAVVLVALGSVLAAGQTAQAGTGRVDVCPVPAYCSPLTCKYTWLSDGTCTGGVVNGVAYCDCLWP